MAAAAAREGMEEQEAQENPADRAAGVVPVQVAAPEVQELPARETMVDKARVLALELALAVALAQWEGQMPTQAVQVPLRLLELVPP